MLGKMENRTWRAETPQFRACSPLTKTVTTLGDKFVWYSTDLCDIGGKQNRYYCTDPKLGETNYIALWFYFYSDIFTVYLPRRGFLCRRASNLKSVCVRPFVLRPPRPSFEAFWISQILPKKSKIWKNLEKSENFGDTLKIRYYSDYAHNPWIWIIIQKMQEFWREFGEIRMAT